MIKQLITASGNNKIEFYLNQIHIPPNNSHKGQNGRVLVIGGSELFHSAAIWSAEIASHFCDIVHFSSTEENMRIFLNLKSKFTNGIIVNKKDIPFYVEEDDAVLVGSGMIRADKNSKFKIRNLNFWDILNISDEGEYTYYLTNYLLTNFPDKQFILDAGSLQMMNKEWLKQMKKKPVLTPHAKEFKWLFGIDLETKKNDEIADIVLKTSRDNNCIIMMKAVDDYISNGQEIIVSRGGNAGLSKGGTGDILAGLTLGLAAAMDPFAACVCASWLVKKTAESLYEHEGYWYNNDRLINNIPVVLNNFLLKKQAL